MTKQEKINQLQRKIDILKSQIELEKGDERQDFLDDAVGHFIRFLDCGMSRYMYVNRRKGNVLGGKSFTRYNGGIQAIDEDCYTFDDNITDCHIITDREARARMMGEFEFWLYNLRD